MTIMRQNSAAPKFSAQGVRWRRPAAGGGKFMYLGVRQRLYLLVALFAAGCAVLAAILIWLGEQRAWDGRAHQLQSVVESAIGVLDVHKKLADAGAMPEAQARQRAFDIVANMHYGNGNYLLVWGMSDGVPSLANG